MEIKIAIILIVAAARVQASGRVRFPEENSIDSRYYENDPYAPSQPSYLGQPPAGPVFPQSQSPLIAPQYPPSQLPVAAPSIQPSYGGDAYIQPQIPVQSPYPQAPYIDKPKDYIPAPQINVPYQPQLAPQPSYQKPVPVYQEKPGKYDQPLPSYVLNPGSYNPSPKPVAPYPLPQQQVFPDPYAVGKDPKYDAIDVYAPGVPQKQPSSYPSAATTVITHIVPVPVPINLNNAGAAVPGNYVNGQLPPNYGTNPQTLVQPPYGLGLPTNGGGFMNGGIYGNQFGGGIPPVPLGNGYPPLG